MKDKIERAKAWLKANKKAAVVGAFAGVAVLVVLDLCG